MVLAITFIAMLLLHQLISKRILYNNSGGKIETVSIDFVHLNNDWSLLMAELETCACSNNNNSI